MHPPTSVPPPTYIVPKLPASETPNASAFALDSYLLHQQRNLCSCGNSWQTSQCFEVWVLPSIYHGAAPTRRLTPLTGPLRSDIAIGFSQLRDSHHFLCFGCLPVTDTRGEPIHPQTEAAWRETLIRKYTKPSTPQYRTSTPKPEPSTTKRPPSAPSLDQL